MHVALCYFTGIIDFNGPDDDFTMSNTFSELYLRARVQRKDVVARAQPNVSSYIVIGHAYIDIG